MSDVLEAHKHSIRHRDEILSSSLCGCFYCLNKFTPSKIVDWCDSQWDKEGATAICPWCGIDSVIGDQSGFAITEEFLTKMNRHWF